MGIGGFVLKKFQEPHKLKVVFFFHPAFRAKSPGPIFSDFNGFPPDFLVDFQSVSIDFLSFSMSFRQLQSVLISFNQFDSVRNTGIY